MNIRFDDPVMPLYQSHKKVRALKISDFKDNTMYFQDPRFGPKKVNRDWAAKHDPKKGGYYVVYADGYESYSPAKAFEEGYKLIK